MLRNVIVLPPFTEMMLYAAKFPSVLLELVGDRGRSAPKCACSGATGDALKGEPWAELGVAAALGTQPSGWGLQGRFVRPTLQQFRPFVRAARQANACWIIFAARCLFGGGK